MQIFIKTFALILINSIDKAVHYKSYLTSKFYPQMKDIEQVTKTVGNGQIVENTTTIDNKISKDDENNTVVKTTITSKIDDGTNKKNKSNDENFLHKTTNVTDWMKKSIEDFVISNGFSIVFFDINAEIMTRLGNITVINTFEIKMKDSDGKIHSLIYNSMSKEYDDINMKWLIDYVKEKEMESILRINTENNDQKVTNTTVIESVVEKKFESLEMTVFFTSSADKIKCCFTDQYFILMWSGSRNVNGAYTFEKTTIRNIRSERTDDDKERIDLEYKWNNWDEYSEVVIIIEQVGNRAKLVMNQKNIPVGLKDSVKTHWMERIFLMICVVFTCTLEQK